MNKVTKAEAGYVLTPGSCYFCSECAFITADGLCSMYSGSEAKVAFYGGCNLWQDLYKGRMAGNGAATRATTGYTENRAGFSCKRCEEFNPAKLRCKKVGEDGPPAPGEISPDGCCNHWEKSPRTGNDTFVQLGPNTSPTMRIDELFRKVIK
jgi:hypothetical protein